MKTHNTLRVYLFNRRVELYEKVNQLKDIKLHNLDTPEDDKMLACCEAELEVVKTVIEICQNRGKY